MPIGIYKRMPLAIRFASKVNIGARRMPHMSTPCDEWTGCRDRFGYGKMTVDKKSMRATHVALMLAGRPLKTGEDALHECDNPPCVRDDHLNGGTKQRNMDEAVSRGLIPRGEAAPRAKIAEWQAVEIKKSLRDGRTIRQVADAMSVPYPTVAAISSGQTWGWL